MIKPPYAMVRVEHEVKWCSGRWWNAIAMNAHEQPWPDEGLHLLVPEAEVGNVTATREALRYAYQVLCDLAPIPADGDMVREAKKRVAEALNLPASSENK